jgi:hypothetical protein
VASLPWGGALTRGQALAHTLKLARQLEPADERKPAVALGRQRAADLLALGLRLEYDAHLLRLGHARTFAHVDGDGKWNVDPALSDALEAAYVSRRRCPPSSPPRSSRAGRG